MKSKALLTAVLLAATNFAWANGGITVDNFDRYSNTDNEIVKVGTNQVKSSLINSHVVYPSDIGKPSSGPAYSGSTSNEQIFCNLSNIGKPSSGPSNNSTC